MTVARVETVAVESKAMPDTVDATPAVEAAATKEVLPDSEVFNADVAEVNEDEALESAVEVERTCA